MCSTDLDCISKDQFCDFGRCDCVPGYEYDEHQSGVCKPSLSGTFELESSNLDNRKGIF